MKNKILWIVFNISLGLLMILIIWIEIVGEGYISRRELVLLKVGAMFSMVFCVLSVVNFFVLNIDWSKASDWWKETEVS